MQDWAIVVQWGVALTAALVFLSLLTDTIQLADVDLAARKEAWDREEANRREELGAEVSDAGAGADSTLTVMPVGDVSP